MDNKNRINFQPNKPERVALKYANGINKVHRTFGAYTLYGLVDGRTMALPPSAAAMVTASGVKPSEPFLVEKIQQPGNKTDWRVSKLDLDAELEQMAGVGVYGVRPAPVKPFTVRSIDDPPPIAPMPPVQRGTGTYGPSPKPQVVNGKIPIDLAFGEVLDWINRELAARGESWDAHTKQAMICTVLIDQSRAGRLAPWQR